MSIAEAVKSIRDELRAAILEGEEQDIVFTAKGIEIELAVTFKLEATGHTGLKLLTFLDLSGEAQASRESLHKIKLSLSVAHKSGEDLKMRSEVIPSGLPG